MSTVPDARVISFSEMEQLRAARDVLQHESRVLGELSRRLDTSFCAAASLLQHCTGTVIVTGMGKAGLIGRKLVATFASTGTPASFLHPAEAIHGDLGCVRAKDVVVMLSNSGTTEEVCRLIPLVRQLGARIIALTASETSPLGQGADVALLLGTIREAGPLELAPTASTTAMLALGDALALVVSQLKGFTRQQFAMYHPGGNLGQRLRRVDEVMRRGDQLRLADERATVREVFVNLRQPGRRTGAVMLVNPAGLLTGLFTDSDLVRLLEMRRESQLDRPIEEVMIRSPKTTTPDALLADAVEILSRYHISELPVIDEQAHPIGLVDITDVLAHMPAEGAA